MTQLWALTFNFRANVIGILIEFLSLFSCSHWEDIHQWRSETKIFGYLSWCWWVDCINPSVQGVTGGWSRITSTQQIENLPNWDKKLTRLGRWNKTNCYWEANHKSKSRFQYLKDTISVIVSQSIIFAKNNRIFKRKY